MARQKRLDKEAKVNMVGFRVTPTLAQEIAQVAEIMDTDISELMNSLVEYAMKDSKLFVKALKSYRRIDDLAEKQLLSMA